ncbi:tyrosine-type recombinase/integrase [Pacificispira sp.]|uniref:tyrosine-type recombinase/integrase n=1 Tax=Pacificispira sp. TaxID=2888761 RepID=UPI003BAD6FC4
MAKTKINKKWLASVQGESKDVIYWDADLPAFGVKVTPKGNKSFVYAYRGTNGQSKRMKLGDHPGMDLEAARTKVYEFKSARVEGIDPAAVRNQRKDSMTLRELYMAWVTEKLEGQSKPLIVKQITYQFDHYVSDYAEYKAVDFKRSDMLQLRRDMADTPGAFNAMKGYIATAYNYAIDSGYLPEDYVKPTRRVKEYPAGSHKRDITPEQLRTLGEVTLDWVQRRQENPMFLLGILFIAVTGARHGEARTLRWDQIDEEAGLIRWTDHKTAKKTGTKTTALTDPVRFIIQQVRNVHQQENLDTDYLFVQLKYTGMYRDVPAATFSNVWKKLRVAVGLEDYKLHSLRSTWINVGSELLDLDTVSKAINHAKTETTRKHYQVFRDERRTDAQTKIGNRVGQAMGLSLAG